MKKGIHFLFFHIFRYLLLLYCFFFFDNNIHVVAEKRNLLTVLAEIVTSL